VPYTKKRRAKEILLKLKFHKSSYHLTRFVLLRLLGFVYFFAFLSLATQVIPLIGSDGLYPADLFLQRIDQGSTLKSFWTLPTVFWFHISDNTLIILSWLGVLLSFILLIGFANIPLLLALWIIYMSFTNIGQIFYGYGWEIQLLETGFLALFFVPLWEWKPFPKLSPPAPIIWLFRWLAFRIFLGAGLIKIRGDSCWRDLTCMDFHYETQPIPNPTSRWIHFLPQGWHKIEVLSNHFVELIVPWFVWIPGLISAIAGIFLISFQLLIILGGNYSFLNWITIVPAIACIEDRYWKKIMPKKLVWKAEQASKHSTKNKYHTIAAWIMVIVVIILSIPVVQNLLSSEQAMNRSFNQWSLVNTYGAFGSVGKERPELIIEGTSEKIITQATEWKEYEIPFKPGALEKGLPIVAPYQPRVAWQIWFAAMQSPQNNPWLIHLVWKLLDNDPLALELIEYNPFPDEPPQFIRIQLYKYEFIEPWEEGVWKRELLGTWLVPLSKNTPELQQYIQANGWN